MLLVNTVITVGIMFKHVYNSNTLTGLSWFIKLHSISNLNSFQRLQEESWKTTFIKIFFREEKKKFQDETRSQLSMWCAGWISDPAWHQLFHLSLWPLPFLVMWLWAPHMNCSVSVTISLLHVFTSRYPFILRSKQRFKKILQSEAVSKLISWQDPS